MGYKIVCLHILGSEFFINISLLCSNVKTKQKWFGGSGARCHSWFIDYCFMKIGQAISLNFSFVLYERELKIAFIFLFISQEFCKQSKCLKWVHMCKQHFEKG